MRLLLLLSTILLTYPLSASATVTFSDGVFDDANWTTTVFTLNHIGGITAQSPAGGNPGEHRAITTFLAMAPRPSKVLIVDLRMGAVYDPSIQGAILTVSHTEDQKCASVDGCVGGGQGWYPALSQNGRFYIHISGTNTGVLETWTTRSLGGLVAADFGEVALADAGITDPASNPDFSATGSPIQFGYARANSFSSHRTGRIDNWQVDVEPVATPEELLFDLIQVVEGFVNTDLKNSHGRALTNKLYAATKQLGMGNTEAAVAKLQAFITQLEGLAGSGQVDQAVADALIAEAAAILDAIDGSGKSSPTALQTAVDETTWGNLKALYQ